MLVCLIDMITPRDIFESYFNVVDSLKTFLDETREVFLQNNNALFVFSKPLREFLTTSQMAIFSSL